MRFKPICLESTTVENIVAPNISRIAWEEFGMGDGTMEIIVRP